MPSSKPNPLPKAIPYTETYYAKLTTLLHGPDTLKNEGYKMEGFGAEEILGLRRCGACHGIFPSFSLSFFILLLLVGWVGLNWGEGFVLV